MQSSKSKAPVPVCPLSIIRRAKVPGPIGERARLHVLNAYGPLVGASIRRIGLHRQDYQDAACGGTLGLLEALNRFNPDLGVPFGAFARPHVLREVLRAVYAGCKAVDRNRADEAVPGGEHSAAGLSAPCDDPADPRTPLPIDEVLRDESEELVGKALDALPSRGRSLVLDLFLRGKSQADIARRDGISRTAINKVFLRTKGDLVGRLACLN
jgi:RNA polymerase sigma factor for flagellar operon FliA